MVLLFPMLQIQMQILMLEEIISETGLEGQALASSRTKGVESLMNKIAKFRDTEWGKEATIADAVDLLGGRIVVNDLESLERVMHEVERKFEGNIIRKENKFMANDGTPVPYRAVHYIIRFSGREVSFMDNVTLPSRRI